MATAATRGIGALLKLGDGASPEVFTTVAELRSHDLNMDTNELDATNHDSPSGFDEYVLGNQSATLDFSGNFLPANATHDESTGILAEYSGKTTSNYQYIMTNAGLFTFSFAGLVKSLSVGTPYDGLTNWSGQIRVSGAVSMAQ